MYIKNSEKRYKSEEHVTFSCQYHVIFCPKYRRPILKGDVEARVRQMFEEIADKYEFRIVEMIINPEDVHLIIDCNPKFGIMNCVRKLKGETSGVIREEFEEIKNDIVRINNR